MRKLLPGLLALAVVLTACGGTQTETATTKDSAAKPEKERLEIAVIPKGLAHQFWLTVRAGADAAGEGLGAEIIWQGPAKETEITRQINIVQDMINRNVDAIVLAACDENALVQWIDNAMDRDIPVITFDSGVQSDRPVSFVATDNVAAAEAAADTLVELIGGSGKVGLIPFVKGAATSQRREEGFRRGIEKHSGVELVSVLYCDSDVAKAMNAANDMMTAHADLKGIFAANEAAAIGAAQAIRVAGKTGEIKLVAFDAAEEEVNALKEGSVQALIVQNPFRMGYLGVESAIKAVRGEQVEKRVDTGITIVTKENLETPEVRKLLNPLDE